MRTAVDWSSSNKANYIDFCKTHPNIKLSFDEWKNIIYTFNETFRDYILETGEKAKFSSGFGEFSVNKRPVRKTKMVGDREIINLPVDWKKSKEKGKKIYIMNYHTEGFSFKWMWFKRASKIKHRELWYFKPSRVTNRLLAHYLKTNSKYQHMYKEWSNK